ncbi:hypothetical protein T4B_2704 [Trichinella pseudospiralis]|uniref:Uncharacterized protein n=1 Tax=Trichinella pseudospiralis TaxID=6337 RepID=A0A0V1IA70_TRIPS|nr:hypothetical protein T4B_2704 [Trichinella pseudospiralis]
MTMVRIMVLSPYDLSFRSTSFGTSLSAGVSSSSVVFIGRDNLLVFPEQRAQSPPDCMWDVVRQFRHVFD